MRERHASLADGSREFPARGGTRRSHGTVRVEHPTLPRQKKSPCLETPVSCTDRTMMSIPTLVAGGEKGVRAAEADLLTKRRPVEESIDDDREHDAVSRYEQGVPGDGRYGPIFDNPRQPRQATTRKILPSCSETPPPNERSRNMNKRAKRVSILEPPRPRARGGGNASEDTRRRAAYAALARRWQTGSRPRIEPGYYHCPVAVLPPSVSHPLTSGI